MLISERNGWHWAITWDNPFPADSTAMVRDLGQLGRLTAVQTKTTYMLAPKQSVGWRGIRKAIVRNLHSKKGNVFYVNLRSGRSFEYGSTTNFVWKKVS